MLRYQRMVLRVVQLDVIYSEALNSLQLAFELFLWLASELVCDFDAGLVCLFFGFAKKAFFLQKLVNRISRGTCLVVCRARGFVIDQNFVGSKHFEVLV